MPTILRIFGFRFFFYSNEGNEPQHVHVEKAGSWGKYWIDPVEVAYMNNFTKQEEKKVDEIVRREQNLFKSKWDEYFGAN